MYFVSIDVEAQVAIILLKCGPYVVIVDDRFCTLGRAPRTKKTLPDFRESGLPDVHEYSAGGQVVNGHPGFGASQLDIGAKVNDYLGSSVGVELRYTNT